MFWKASEHNQLQPLPAAHAFQCCSVTERAAPTAHIQDNPPVGGMEIE